MLHWFSAFDYLSRRGRPINMGGPPGYISIESQKAYLELKGGYDPSQFLEVIGGIDEFFVTAVERVQQKRGKAL